MHTTRTLFCAAAGALLLSALSGAALADSVMKKDGILVNSAGMTVYTFDKDAAGSGTSKCIGPCADNWPAVAAPASVAAPYSAFTRDDGVKQLAYNGKPLYTFKKDTKAGDRNGDNFKDMWHVVKD
jgi:predicted lipoprotein with Yx(FWY)xxD motif